MTRETDQYANPELVGGGETDLHSHPEGSVKLPDGSSGSPSLAFTDDTDTGLYLGANWIPEPQVSIGVGGTEVFNVTVSGIGIGVDASATTNPHRIIFTQTGTNITASNIAMLGYGYGTLTSAANSGDSIQPCYMAAVLSASNTQNWTSDNWPQFTPFRASFMIENGAAGTITHAAGFVDYATILGADVTVTNYAGLWTGRATVTDATLINHYGVYVFDMSGGTNKWAFYAKSDPSYFGGGIQVVGNTTLDTGLTGVLRADSGVVSVDAGGGGTDIKSGTKAAAIGSNSVTFNTAFASTPQVVLTVQDNIALRDCLYQITAVSTTGFSFDADVAATYAWIATSAGDP